MGLFDSIAGLWGAEPAREREIEAEHDLELSGLWTRGYQDQLEDSLARLPADHVAPIDEIQLGGIDGWGLHGDGKVSVATPSLVDSERHRGDTSELAGHVDPIQQFAMTVVHEIGHNYHEQHPEVADKLLAAAGMQDGLRARDLRRSGLSADEIDTLEADDDESRQYWDYAEIEEDGTIYRNDKYDDDRYVAYDAAAVPRGGAHSDGRDEDSWYYARSSPHEYFAEMYTKAVNVPELLHADLVSGPAAEAAREEAEVAAARRALVEAQGLDNVGALLELAKESLEASRAAHGQEAKREQWDIMRGEVFGVTDELVEDRAGDIEALHPDGVGRADEFRARAAKCATPHQLERLFEGYL